jgi:hypothetical protein
MRGILVRAVTALAVAGAATAGARAQDPAFVGTWASNPARCQFGQDLEDAPMIMRRTGYDQHETHCAFGALRKRGAAWAVKARCRVEGSRLNTSFTLAVTGNRLILSDKTGARTLQRCP